MRTYKGLINVELGIVICDKSSLFGNRYLNTTHLLCNCELSWLPVWIESKQFKSNVRALCLHPKQLERRSIFNLTSSEFVCGK